MAWAVILIFSFIVFATKIFVCDLTISYSDHLFTVVIVINTCSNLRRITSSDTTITTESPFILPCFSIIHHSPINCISTPIAQSYSTLSPKSHTFQHIVPPEGIIWLSFDTFTIFFGSLLSFWLGTSVTNFSFETDSKHYQIYSLLPSSTQSTYISLSHLLHHLQLLKNVNLDEPLM